MDAVTFVLATDPAAGTPPVATVVAGTLAGGQFIQAMTDVATFDSGLTTLPNVDTLLTALVVGLRSLFLMNLTGQVVKVQVTNNAGTPKAYLKDLELLPHAQVTVTFGGVLAAGVRWSCDTVAAVNAQLSGNV